MTIDSCRGEGNIHKFTSGFPMLKPVCQHSQSQRLSLRDRFIRSVAVRKYSRHLNHFCQPPTIFLSLVFDCERHHYFLKRIVPRDATAKQPNGGVDAAARIQSSIAGPVMMRNTLPPLASNDLFGRVRLTDGAILAACCEPAESRKHDAPAMIAIPVDA